MVVEELAEDVDALLDVDVSALSDAELHQAVIELQRQSDRLTAARARLVREWDHRRGWAADGSKAPWARLARECKLAPSTARAELRRAHKLARMPHTAAAARAGRISADQADLLARANSERLAAQFADYEHRLVADAQRLSHRDLERVLRYWQHHADAASNEDDAQRAHHDRELHASRTFQGCVEGRFSLDPIDGTIVCNELHRLEQQLFEADWADARATHGEHATSADLARSPAQRRADALVEMARRSAAMPPDARPARPLITVLVGYETFAGTICELGDRTVTTPGSILGLLDEADIERIVFDTPARVIEVGEQTRFFTPAQRRAVIARDRHCQHHSGCDVPAEHCQIDHITEWHDGGTTTLDNARALCKIHNRQRPGRRAPPEPA